MRDPGSPWFSMKSLSVTTYKLTIGTLSLSLLFCLMPAQALADNPCSPDAASSSSATGEGLSACQKQIYNSGIYSFDIDVGVTVCASGGDSSLVGNDAVEKIMNYFVGKGLTAPQAAGIVGNIQSETAGTFDPTIVEGGGHADAPTDGKGYGLSQWTYASRQQPLVGLANKEGLPVGSMGVQLDYIWQELTSGYKDSTLTPLQAATTPQDAAVIILVHYEVPRDHSPTGPNAITRSRQAVDALVAYGASSTGVTTPVSTTPATTGESTCVPSGSGTAQAGEGFIGNCAGKGSMAPIHCGQCVSYVEWALGVHGDPKKGPYGSLTDQSGPLRYAAATVTKNLGAKGFTVDRTPAVHATFSMSGAPGALGNHWGHTGIVSKVNTDSAGNLVSIVVEQSNWSPSGNQELYNGDTVFTPEQLKKYDTTFAHTEVGWR